jgi:prepilin-type N-terminal cleavage/methylation domain-containing protein
MTCVDLKYRGFSLIELMFTIVISSMILLLTVSLLSRSRNSYEEISNSVLGDREARAAMNQLSSDLSSAMDHDSEIFSHSLTLWPADRIGFLSLQPTQAQEEMRRVGDLCGIRYYLKDLMIDHKVVRCLMRGFHDSKEIFSALSGKSLAPLLQEEASSDEPIAFGVVSFEARPKSQNGQGQQNEWIQDGGTGPQVIDVKLVIARSDLMKRLKFSKDWDQIGTINEKFPESENNKSLEVYHATLRFGNNATP